MSCPPTQRLFEPTPTERTKARVAPSPDVCATTVNFSATAKREKNSRGVPSCIVPATTLASCAHADQAIRGQISSLSCRARHHSDWMSPCIQKDQRQEKRTYLSCPPPLLLSEPSRTSEQRPKQRPRPSCPSPQWLGETTNTERKEARAAPSAIVPAKTVVG